VEVHILAEVAVVVPVVVVVLEGAAGIPAGEGVVVPVGVVDTGVEVHCP
jgi:hypothetical protein